MDDETSTSNSVNTIEPVIEKLTRIDREATNFNFDSLPNSSDCENGLSYASDELISNIINYDLNQYLTCRINPRKSLFKTVPFENYMKYIPNEVLNSPLLLLPEELKESALELYNILRKYMGDKNTKKGSYNLVQKHISITLSSTIDLKDEAYIQVIKQLKDNLDKEKLYKAWNFLAILSSTITPSLELYHAILHYLMFEIKNNLNKEIVQRSNYIFARMIKMSETRRKFVPTEFEISHIEEMKPLMYPIYFFSNTHTYIPIESYTNIKEFKQSIMIKLEMLISKSPYYSIYEICEKEKTIEERFLEDTEKVVDIISLWNKEKENSKLVNEDIEFKMYLKLFIYYEYSKNDVDTITLMYVQTNYDVIKSKFNISKELAIDLAAYQLSINYGNNYEVAEKFIIYSYKDYIPAKLFNNKSEECSIIIDKVCEKYKSLEGIKPIEAKIKYLELIKSNPLFMAHQFNVKFSEEFNDENIDNIPSNLIIGLKNEEIVICDKERRELMTFSYNYLASWGVNSSILVLVIQKTQYELKKIYFECYNTKIIQVLLTSYTGLLAGEGISDILHKTYESNKMFDNMSKAKLEEGETARSKACTSYIKYQ